MRSQWNFYFESKGLTFERTHKYQGIIGSEQAEAFGFAPQEFKFVMVIEPDASPKFEGMQQTGTLKVILPGNMEQTKELARWMAVHASESVTFSSGELILLGGLITGEYLPDTPEEEIALGDKRYFAQAYLEEVTPPPVFNGNSLSSLSSASVAGMFVKQYNAAMKAGNPIDIFLGLFKILEDFYGPKTKKKTLAQAFKESVELYSTASTVVEYYDKTGTRLLTQTDFEKLVDDLVNTRHNCAHLKSSVGFGLTHGDPRVSKEVKPLINPLRTLVYESIRTKIKNEETA